MFIINSYSLAVIFCIITMLCWGSWANTSKVSTEKWPFPLFYWDHSLGLIIISLVYVLTMGSIGDSGRSFVTDLQQADTVSITSALIGGVVFNLSNLLIVAAIAVAGLSVAFPVGVGLAFASAAAAISVTRMGAQPSAPTRNEIERFLSESS